VDLNAIDVSRRTDDFELIGAPVLAGQTYYIKVASRVTPGDVSYYLSIDLN